jgi:type IV secretory pathway VirB10-like protein
MTDMLEYISTWSVLKWVVLVLVAGFIGQFGRMLAEAIIAKVRLRRAKRDSSSLPDDQQKQKVQSIVPVDPSAPVLPSEPPVEISVAELSSKPAVDVEVPDKKLLKAMAKARKKEAKKKAL